MALKTILFLAAFIACSGGALYMPLLGILGYVGHYNLGPERQWWGAPLNDLGLRYSYTLALMAGIGMALHWKSLRYGKPFLHSQEKLLLVFLGLIWLSTFVGEPTTGAYTLVDHPSVKMTKVVIFALMLTHVVTTVRRLDLLLWVLTAGALVLGLQAYWTPYSQFTHGRIETVGGPDFHDSNTLAAYLAALLPLIGILFLRSGWKGKLFCLMTAPFAINTIILSRSRGAVVGICGGALVALLLAPRKQRASIAVGTIVLMAAGLYLSDPGFLARTSTITASEEDRDRSTESRLEIWQATIQMISNHPLGVGAGNFFQSIGRVDPRFVDRDTHNTFLRCAAEVGVQGIAVFLAIIVNAVMTLRNIAKRAREFPEADRAHIPFVSCGLLVSIGILLTCGLFGSLTYLEALWWLLLIPVCLLRAVNNLKEDARLQLAKVVVPSTKRSADRRAVHHI